MTIEVRSTVRSDARDNRLRILTVARHAFADEGVDVPIREIARRSDVGVATVYRHFPTKEALLAEAFADQLASCREIVDEGLETADAWEGFCQVVAKLMTVHALDRGFARAFTSRMPLAETFTADRDRSLRKMHDLLGRAKATGRMRSDLTLADVSLLLMANEGIRAETPARRVVATRRFVDLIIRSFEA